MDIQKALRRRIVPLDVKKKVDRLLKKYQHDLTKKWIDRTRAITNDTTVTKFQKAAHPYEVEDAEQKKSKLKKHLGKLYLGLSAGASPYFADFYKMGKERGQGLTGQPLDDELSADDNVALQELIEENDGYLDNFINSDLYDAYSEIFDNEYDTEEDFTDALDGVASGNEARLLMYAMAGLGALAVGFSSAVQEADITDGEIEYNGGFWHTAHDDNVCDGCEEQEDHWMTWDEFENEYQTNDCLTNCRCAELFEPAPSPDDSEKYADSPSKAARNRVIAIDLDGTILDNTGTKEFGEPLPGARQALAELKSAGYTIIIHTVRGDEEAVARELQRYQIPFDYINHNPNQPDYANRGKPLAEVYIDDRAVHFNGNWNNVVETVRQLLEHGGMEKGGPGSGSWEGPGQPRFAHTAATTETVPTETTDIPRERATVPAPRKLGHITLKYDETDYNPENWERHQKIEQMVEKALTMIPDEHKQLVTEVIIDDDLTLNTFRSSGNPIFTEKDRVPDVFAYTEYGQSYITVNANAHERVGERQLYNPRAYLTNLTSTLIHETGHKVFDTNVKAPLREKLGPSGERTPEYEELSLKWRSLLGALGASPYTKSLLRNNERGLKIEERGAGAYRAYIQKGQQFKTDYPHVYEIIKKEWFAGKEYDHGRLLTKDDSEWDLYDYTLPNGIRIYSIVPRPDLETDDLLVTKGGPGSGSWEAPGQPRFDWATSEKPDEDKLLQGGQQYVGDVTPKDFTTYKEITTTISSEMKQKIQDARDKLKMGTPSKDLYFKDGKYTDERTQLHDSIIAKFDNPTAVAKGQPTLVLTGGIPGSGKSAILEEKDISHYVVIDSDEIKKSLPDYAGWNAALLQTEADDIIARLVSKSVTENKNIILDSTMRKYAEYDKLVTSFRTSGYSVGVWFANLPMDKAMKRAVERFDTTGRFVDLAYIASHDEKNIATFQQLKSRLDFYEHYNTDVARGEKPRLVERK